ncbi:hypothetical protein [Amorphus sp. 3PC139-8]|uniref:hypothetical protein n=1 Tax=Amorphus sp. 3PC139-8 TaxID=2735676 RepID=UPI00345CD7C4
MRAVRWIISLPFRIVGTVLFLLGLAAAGYDIYMSVQIDKPASTSLGELWFSLDKGSLNLAQAVVQRYLSPTLWDPYIQMLLLAPGWLVLGGFGIVFLVLARVIWRSK